MVKLVLFDIDGTLVRTGRAGVKAFAKAFATEFGLHDGSERLKFAGRTDMSLVREFFGLHSIDPTPEHFDRFFAVYLRYLEEIIVQCDGEIIPGVADFMSGLKKLPEPPLFGLLTGNVKRGAEIKLKHFRLWDRFEFGAFADDHEERDCIAAIARHRGEELLRQEITSEQVLVIGDTPLDVKCARAIKARIIAVATGGHPIAELREHRPDWAVEDLTRISAEQACA